MQTGDLASFKVIARAIGREATEAALGGWPPGGVVTLAPVSGPEGLQVADRDGVLSGLGPAASRRIRR